MTPTDLSTVQTPCLILDRTRLERNIASMAKAVRGRGVRLRPHLKTAKSLDVARLVAPAADDPIAVSTLREAEYFFEGGYRDIFYAVGIGPGKLVRAAELLRAGCRLLVMVDSVEAAAAVREVTDASGLAFRVVIEVDSGQRRGGVLPEGAALLPIARVLETSLAGVATHAGQSYGARTTAELRAVAELEVRAASDAAALLRGAGFTLDTVSIGSSPTALADSAGPGITEIRAGVYMFWDVFQAGIRSCSLGDIAISVLAEVIGRPVGRNEFLVDAGAFALSKDISTAELPPEKQAGYGLVCDLAGRIQPGVRVAKVWQEHGLIQSERPLAPGHFEVGSRVRILPNHACPTAAAYSVYHVASEGASQLALWPRVNGW